MFFDAARLEPSALVIEGPARARARFGKEQQLQKLEDTKICRAFHKGRCERGDACPFRHGLPYQKTVVCKHWWRGLCKKGDDCEFLHVLDFGKMPLCHFYVNDGQCSNPDCVFLHKRPEELQKECPWYAQGFCKHGAGCGSKHVRRRACPDFLAGFCLKGPECELAHPKFERRDKSVRHQLHALAQPLQCSKCGREGHTDEFCRQVEFAQIQHHNRALGRKRELTEVTCFKCGETGHYANLCPNRRRQVAGGPGAPVPQTQQQPVPPLPQFGGGPMFGGVPPQAYPQFPPPPGMPGFPQQPPPHAMLAQQQQQHQQRMQMPGFPGQPPLFPGPPPGMMHGGFPPRPGQSSLPHQQQSQQPR